MKLGDTVIPYHEDFRLYITTKLPNPHYTPEVFTKLTLINFTLSPRSALGPSESGGPLHTVGLSSFPLWVLWHSSQPQFPIVATVLFCLFVALHSGHSWWDSWGTTWGSGY